MEKMYALPSEKSGCRLWACGIIAVRIWPSYKAVGVQIFADETELVIVTFKD